MTYLGFLLLFLVPPTVLLIGFGRSRGVNNRESWRAISLVAMIALVYTAPWDNYLLYRSVWWYGPDRVLGTIGYVPIEEYTFMLLQSVMTGLFTVVVFGRGSSRASHVADPSVWVGRIVFGLVATAGILLLLLGADDTLYLGLILGWAGPVLAAMWWIGGDRFVLHVGRFATSVLIPSVYLWIGDAVAISMGVWEISDRYTLGLEVGPLPLEEATFFLVTNLLIVQGVLLFWVPTATPNLRSS